MSVGQVGAGADELVPEEDGCELDEAGADELEDGLEEEPAGEEELPGLLDTDEVTVEDVPGAEEVPPPDGGRSGTVIVPPEPLSSSSLPALWSLSPR